VFHGSLCGRPPLLTRRHLLPLTNFRCPDGEKISIVDCLDKCRMATRCLSKPTLKAIADGRRKWTGTPSTTQLLNGTRMEYLKVKHDYAVSPPNQAFSLMGIAHHERLAKPEGEWESEKKLTGVTSTGIADLLIPDEDEPGKWILLDYKNFGSYRVGMVLGITQIGKEPHPTEVYKSSGKWGRAGSSKMVPKFGVDEAKRDFKSEQLQLNNYRVLAEDAGYKISKLQLQITVRDGGTQAAKSRGIFKNVYYPVDIPFLDKTSVWEQFTVGSRLLVAHVNADEMPPVCTEEERWNDRRCKEYCDVAEFCDYGKNLLWMEAQKP
jgi:hypothetical protein